MDRMEGDQDVDQGNAGEAVAAMPEITFKTAT